MTLNMASGVHRQSSSTSSIAYHLEKIHDWHENGPGPHAAESPMVSFVTGEYTGAATHRARMIY